MIEGILNYNFTRYYLIAAVLGVGAMMIWDRGRPLLRGFVGGWLIMMLLYGMIFSDYIYQHTYYQMPFLFLVAFSTAYLLWHVARACNRRLKDRSGYLLIVAFFIGSMPSVVASVRASYQIMDYGSDVAGEYLKKRIPGNGYFFHRGDVQSYSVCVVAQKKCGWPRDISDFKLKEFKRNVEFITFCPVHYFDRLPEEIKKYIESHYHVVHMGFIRSESGPSFKPVTLILQKGGQVNIEAFMRGRMPRQTIVYDTPKGPVPLFVLEKTEA